MAENKQGGGNGGFEETAAIAALLVGAIAIWLVWMKARHIIVYLVFGMDWLQYQALAKTSLLGPHGHVMLTYVQDYLLSKNGFDPHTITFSEIVATQADIGHRVRFLLPPVIGVAAVYTLIHMKGDGLKRRFSLSGRKVKVYRFLGIRIYWGRLQKIISALTSLTGTKKYLVSETKQWARNSANFMEYQAETWRVALAGARFNPDTPDPEEEQARTPMMWLRDNDISLTKREGLNDDQAEAVFSKQLGPSWQGLENATPEVQAICILGALNYLRHKKLNHVRDRLTEIYILHPSEAKEQVKELLAPFLADKKIVDGINRRCGKHAYTNTAVLGIFGLGGPFREWGGGESPVLSSSMILWLKKINRTLYYALNNVGRRSFYVEGAGVVSHFFAERVCGGPLAEAHVDSAIDGLGSYLDKEGIMDLEEFFHVEHIF